MWQTVERAVKQPEASSRPTQSGQGRGQRGHASHCRMGSLAGFRCRAGVGPVNSSVMSSDEFRF